MIRLLQLLRLDDNLERTVGRIARNPLRAAVVTMVAGIVIGGVTFSLLEKNASIPDGMWWAFISMTTVGYGDFSPHTTVERFLAVFVVLTGVAAVSIWTATLAGRIAQVRLSQAHETPELDDDVDVVIGHLEVLKIRLTELQAHAGPTSREGRR